MDYVLGVGGFDITRVVEEVDYKAEEKPKAAAHGHSHDHHGHSHEGGECGECGETTADGHSHDHGHSHDAATCTDPTHDHGHSHAHLKPGEVCNHPSHALEEKHNDEVKSVSLKARFGAPLGPQPHSTARPVN